jgi:DNA-binding MarR family transcriptional regulator
MTRIDVTKLWALNYRLVTSVIVDVAPAVQALGIEVKELFLLAELDDYPNPAGLADRLMLPRPTVTGYLKRLESIGLVGREIDSADLRRYKLSLTANGRKVMTRGLALLADAFGERLSRLTAAQAAQFDALVGKMV